MYAARRIKQWIVAPVESVALQVPRAFIASMLALAVDFCIYVFCVRAIGVPATLAAVVGYLAGGVLQYVLCSLWVFSVSLKSDAVGFVAFTILSLVGLAITWLMIFLAHDCAGAPPELAKISAVGLAFTWNFLSRKFLLFRAANSLPQVS